jgi:hypothetical protein
MVNQFGANAVMAKPTINETIKIAQPIHSEIVSGCRGG